MVKSRTHDKRIPRTSRGDGRKKALKDKQPGKRTPKKPGKKPGERK